VKLRQNDVAEAMVKRW